MRQLNPNEAIDVGQVMQRLLSQRPRRESFKWECTREQAVEILKACYISEVESRHRTCLMDQATEGHIYRLASWITDPTDTHFGVMMIGGVGSGKTTLLRALQKGYWWMMQDEGCDYQMEYRLDIVNARNLTDTTKTWQRLGIDELGIEPIEVQSYGNITTPSSDVLTYRYDRRLPTFVTTNLAQRPEDGETLRQRYGDRLADRFNEMFFVIAFYNKSYR